METNARIHNLSACSATLARKRAVSAIESVDVDAFFREQVDAMRERSHWTDLVAYNQFGNHMAAFEFVAAAGQDPEAVFGPTDYGNVYMMSVRALSDGFVRIEFSTRDDSRVLDVRRFAPEEFNREALVDAFSAFVIAAVRRATAVTTKGGTHRGPERRLPPGASCRSIGYRLDALTRFRAVACEEVPTPQA